MLVLKELSSESLSGYDLINKLAHVIGKAPSSGSVYPLLQELDEKGIVNFKQEGRRKVYSITAKGRRLMERILKEKEDITLKNAELIRLIGDLTGDDEASQMTTCVDQLKSGQELFLKNFDVWADFKTTAMKLASQPDFKKKEKKLVVIIKDATKKIKALAREKTK